MANKKLTKVIGFEELGGALFNLAQQEAKEATTKALVGIYKSKTNLKKTGIHLGKAVIAKVASSYIESEIIDTAVDIYSGVKVVQAGFTGYKAVNEFTKGYKETTDTDVEAIRELLGLSEKKEEDDEE